ncbi:MAG TPA: nucleoside deaminase [Saprospiraceae bacterium]|nr:nucleoside deaminase [Saprospiraceae bacterium]
MHLCHFKLREKMLSIHSDVYFMEQALKEAQKAFDFGEVPVGAVVVANKQIIARAHNQTQMLNDATAHAEIMALSSASNYLGSKYLQDCTLYVTLEPCVMCAGAMYWSKVSKVVYGASDDQRGFMRYGKELLHPQTKLAYGIKQEECAAILQKFFEKRR